MRAWSTSSSRRSTRPTRRRSASSPSTSSRPCRGRPPEPDVALQARGGRPTVELPDQVRANAEQLARFVEELPADAFGRPGADGEWSLAEICGHAAEFPPFHARVLLRVAGGDADARVGRGDDDTDRQAGSRRCGGARPADVAKAIRAAAEEGAAILAGIPPDGWATT